MAAQQQSGSCAAAEELADVPLDEPPHSPARSLGPEAQENAECSVCLQALGKGPFQLGCGHQFHHECLCRWFTAPAETQGERDAPCSCPLCRAPLGTAEAAALVARGVSMPRARLPSVVVYCALPWPAASLVDGVRSLWRRLRRQRA